MTGALVLSNTDYLPPPAWTTRLRRTDRSEKVYKPAALLVALDLIEEGLAIPDLIPLELCAKRLRDLLGRAGLLAGTRRGGSLHYPLYRLSTAPPGARRVPFWVLLKDRQPREQMPEPSSLAGLLRAADAAAFIEPLRADLATPEGRQRVRWAIYDLLECDGEPASTALLRAHDRDLPRVQEEVARLAEAEHADFRLDDPAAARIESLATRVIRDRALRQSVLALYDHACALCHLRLRWDQLVEAQAAHIKPRALLGADDVRNALALCGVHHWAFDLGLWSATNEAVVVVREPPTAATGATGPYEVGALAALAGQRLSAPARESARPAREALEWHRRLVFEGAA